MSNAFRTKSLEVAICITKLLNCNWQEWLRNPRTMSLAANACSCNSSFILVFAAFWLQYCSEDALRKLERNINELNKNISENVYLLNYNFIAKFWHVIDYDYSEKYTVINCIRVIALW